MADFPWGTSKKFVHGCACQTSKFWLLLYLILSPFSSIYHSSIYQFCTKTPNLLKFGAFYHHLLKVHSINVNWVPSSVMKTPHRYTKIHEKAPQRQAHYMYTMSMWVPPGIFLPTFSTYPYIGFCTDARPPPPRLVTLYLRIALHYRIPSVLMLLLLSFQAIMNLATANRVHPAALTAANSKSMAPWKVII